MLKYLSSMNQYLVDAGLYESQEEAVGREEVLGRLDQVSIFKSYLGFRSYVLHVLTLLMF